MSILQYVDSLLFHRPASFFKDTAGVEVEEIVRAANWLIDQGLTFYWGKPSGHSCVEWHSTDRWGIGTSEWSAAELKEAWAVADKLNLIGPMIEQVRNRGMACGCEFTLCSV